ncbi:ScbA/BarX family gamma-butyrolactone biosynthesis protein (plasmid) [Streptomyces sp. BI20]|uniref:ScbA/BarX family gamma-butyrolactone biosynthesis protein n=1 Tax=Streptomyces sp. BI20 TaxID=3403460 RepID=UPI003C70C319
MTTAPSLPDQAADTLAAVPDLSYDRTIDRSLVHRDSLNEVFLTDLRPLPAGTGPGTPYVAAAQLPRSHAYYGDHLLSPTLHDPILLLEAARQAALAGSHAFHGVPRTDKFILTHLRVHLTRPDRLAVGAAPCPLRLHAAIDNHHHREGRTTGLDHRIEFRAGDTVIGTAAVGLRFKSADSYRELRLRGRDGRPLPSSADHEPGAGHSVVDPYLVGRANPENVVLSDVRTQGENHLAALRVPGRHPSMFDHPQDHLPGMVLAEAARQLALRAALETRGMSPSRTVVTDLAVTFTRFGELDSPSLLTAVVGPDRPAPEPEPHYTQGGVLEPEEPTGSAVGRPVQVRVEATQDGASLCLFSLTLTRVRTPR